MIQGDDMTEKHYYTYAEVSAILNISEVTVRRLARQGSLRRVKIGSRALVPRHVLLNYMDGLNTQVV